MVFNSQAKFDIAHRLHSGERVPLSDVYAFVSGLYFRGKLAYARHFSRDVDGHSKALIITPNCGLVSLDECITIEQLRDFSGTDIDASDAAYHGPLRRDCADLARRVASPVEIVLLGSIASGKYIEILLEQFGENLMFPQDFVGRGDLSRGGLMLRAVAANVELAYIRAAGAVRRGARPPKLPQISPKL
jgi:hypothetical protein